MDRRLGLDAHFEMCRGGEVENVSPEFVVVGDEVEVVPGDGHLVGVSRCPETDDGPHDVFGFELALMFGRFEQTLTWSGGTGGTQRQRGVSRVRPDRKKQVFGCTRLVELGLQIAQTRHTVDSDRLVGVEAGDNGVRNLRRGVDLGDHTGIAGPVALAIYQDQLTIEPVESAETEVTVRLQCPHGHHTLENTLGEGVCSRNLIDGVPGQLKGLGQSAVHYRGEVAVANAPSPLQFVKDRRRHLDLDAGHVASFFYLWPS